ncbi:hypothetical protein QYF36_007397 [Acer negundo]|nr:hypothetical protein QYF36_007397 [Acer negundo]
MFVFEEYDRCDKPIIKYVLTLFLLSVEFPKDDFQLLLMMESTGPSATSVLELEIPSAASDLEVDIPDSGPPTSSVKGYVSDVDHDYKVNEESDDDADSDVSLVDECGEVDDDIHDQYDPDGDDTWLLKSSDEENCCIKMAKYCRQHQWAPNLDGFIEIMSYDSLTIYRAKKIVLNNLKTDHIASYAKMKKCGNTIIAMNPGFKKGVRPLIGICGCHLTRQLGGVMLSATALDGDIGIFPIAFCSTFKDNMMNGKLWCIARAGSKAKFTERHAFECDIKSDHITNNMSKCFNNWIKDERDKPILTLLEHLRRKIIVRFSEKWDEVETLKDSITLYISGLPCKHAISVFMYNRVFPHDHVHWYYTKEALKLSTKFKKNLGGLNTILNKSINL